MKVGFPVQADKGLESTVYNHFGSAPAFVIVDTDQELVASLENSNSQHVPGSCNPVAALGGNKLDAVVVGGIGAGAIMKLKAMGIKVFNTGGVKVSENIELLKKNSLREITSADVCGGHQGQCAH